MSKLSKKNRRLRKPKSAAAGAASAAKTAGEGFGKAAGIFGLVTSAASLAMQLKKKKKNQTRKPTETVGFKP
jgi:hypothetical protein